jgi:hypothetical protein
MKTLIASLFTIPILPHLQCALSHQDHPKANFTPHESMGAMEQVLLLTSHGNHEGNLKNARTYLQ